MDVFTYYDASPGFTGERAESFRAWAGSWSKLGWTPRILTARKAKQSSLYPKIFPRVGKAALPYLAFHAAGGGWYAPTSAINYDFRPCRRRQRVVLYHDGVTWATKRGIEEILRALGTREWDRYFLLKFLTLDLLGKSRYDFCGALVTPSPFIELVKGSVFAGGIGGVLRAC